MRITLTLATLSFCLLLAHTAPAKERPVIVAPSVMFLKTIADNPPHWVRKGLVDSHGFAGTLRTDRELNGNEIRQLKELEVTFLGRPDAPVEEVGHIGSIYPVRIGWSHFDELLEFPRLVQVESDYLMKPLSPLNVTVPQTGAPEYIEHIQKSTGERPGEGIRIADIDSGIDVFHPAFFYPDGGYYAWLDVDGNGELTFGTDACDLNGNGEADAEEILQYHDATLVNMYDWGGGSNFQELQESLAPNGQFDPDVDWIYADTNGSGERDFGQDAGYFDDAPGFGEPILLQDDVNGNGVLDLDEKLVMLGTSKIAKTLIGGEEYVAGVNLTEVTSALFPPSTDGVPTAMHGTGVAGILAANSPRMHRFVGVAPFAELYMIDSSKEGYQTGGVDETVSKLVWAKQQAVDIVLFEFSSWGMTFMDGTSNLEMAIDQLYEKNGIMQVVPAGNLADSGKHMETDLPPGTTDLGIVIPDNYPGYDLYAFETPALIFALYWSGDPDDFSLEVARPDSTSYVPLPHSQYDPVDLGDDMAVLSYTSKSSAGFCHRIVYILDQGQKAVETGKWNFRFKNTTGTKLPVHGYLNDYLSGWGRAVEFDKFESTATTICHPSTADSALSVAAYGGEFGSPEELGHVRDYSSRGPRMDGFQAIDIAAPDDPFTPLARMKTGLMMGLLDVQASYTVFGGTSGAGPHVAGALALMRQLDPEATQTTLFSRMIKGAVQEGFMGTLPNKEYGYGKLNVYKTAFGITPPGNLPPEAAATLTFRNGFYATLDAGDSMDPEMGPLRFRWDFDYDGSWDINWTDSPHVEYAYPAVGTYTAKVAVQDENGAIDYAIVTFEVLDDYQPGKQPTDPETDVLIPTTSDAVWSPDLAGDTPDTPGSDEDGSSSSGGCHAGPTGASATALLLLLALALLALARKKGVRHFSFCQCMPCAPRNHSGDGRTTCV